MMPSFRKTLDHGCQERDPPDRDVAATVKAGVILKEFDFYVDFVLNLIKQLEPLGDE
jgi:hypothetical protein